MSAIGSTIQVDFIRVLKQGDVVFLCQAFRDKFNQGVWTDGDITEFLLNRFHTENTNPLQQYFSNTRNHDSSLVQYFGPEIDNELLARDLLILHALEHKIFNDDKTYKAVISKIHHLDDFSEELKQLEKNKEDDRRNVRKDLALLHDKQPSKLCDTMINKLTARLTSANELSRDDKERDRPLEIAQQDDEIIQAEYSNSQVLPVVHHQKSDQVDKLSISFKIGLPVLAVTLIAAGAFSGTLLFPGLGTLVGAFIGGAIGLTVFAVPTLAATVYHYFKQRKHEQQSSTTTMEEQSPQLSSHTNHNGSTATMMQKGVTSTKVVSGEDDDEHSQQTFKQPTSPDSESDVILDEKVDRVNKF